MALIKLEGIASNIRTNTSIHGTMSRGKGNVGSTTTMNFLLDGKAAYAQFGEAMSINEGDRVVVAGVQKSNGLKALAYNNLTNGTYGDSGKLARIIGYIIVGLALFCAFLIIPVLLLPVGLWLLWIGYRAKRALAICRRVTAPGEAAPSAA